MSEKKHRDGDNTAISASTLDIDDFEPLSDGQPEEYEPDSEYSDEEEYYPSTFAERLLSTVIIVLSALLTAGSAIFWWYFVSRLTTCPAAVNNRALYPVMLAACAAFSLAVTIGQIMRRRTYPSPERWMVNICVSGAITSLMMIIYNTAVLGNVFEWGDVLPTLCFSVSGCALPAALYALVWALVMALVDHIRYENSKDINAVFDSVIAQCEGRFI